MQAALALHVQTLHLPYNIVLIDHYVRGNWAYGYAGYTYRSTNKFVPTEYIVVLARREANGNWSALVPSKEVASEYNRWLDEVPMELISPDDAVFLRLLEEHPGVTTIATASGYRLPWAGGWGATLTQGPTGHGYQAWDFDLWQGQWSGMVGTPGYVVAAKGGVVVFAKDIAPDSEHCGGCANVVIIRHSPNEYSWYYHLQQGSIPQAIKEARQNGTPIEAGTVIGMEGNSGRSTNPHLHFMVTDGIPDLSQYDENDEDRAPWPQNNNFLVVDFEEWDEQNLTPFSANYLNPSGGVVLYWDADYKGPSAKFTPTNAGAETRLPDFLYHRASSIRVTPEGEYFVALYSDIHSHPLLGGYCRGWWWTEANFDNDYCDPKENPAPERSMNDAISSLKVTSKQIYCGYAAGVTGFPARASAIGMSGEQEQFCEPAPPNDSATFLSDVTLPDGSVVSPGQALVKTWRVKNTGSSTWGSGYQLVFYDSEQMGGPNAVDIPAAAPGDEVDISVNLITPSSANEYTGRWRLRNPQGTYFGDILWVKINVMTNNSESGNITLFDVTPSSPSSTTSVHLVGRVRYFTDFRSMRFVIGTEVFEMTNLRQIGDQLEISADWNTANLPRGNYAIVFEVAKNGDPDWANAERQVKTYTLTGTPTSTNRAPDRPLLQSPYNWYLKDASGSAASVELCVHPSNDPDGNTVQYWFEVKDQGGGVVATSGWSTSPCWTNTYNPGTYSWRVKAGDGSAESDWSSDTWNFTIAKGGVYIGSYQIFNPNTNDTHLCVFVTYDGIQGPEVYAWLNKAPDGSENGEWRLLDHYGPNAPPDCTQSNYHGFWIHSPEYEMGVHKLRISAVKRDSGANAKIDTTYSVGYIRPSDVKLLAPSTRSNNGTWWNHRTIHFEWSPSIRAEWYTLRVSTNPNPWNDPAPVTEQSFPSGVTSFDYTFSQDYPKLYWSVRAGNSVGATDSGPDVWFGVDTVAPTCQVQNLPSSTYENVFQVNWRGGDDSSGVRAYDIQYRDSTRDTWNDWLLNQPASKTYDLFTGQPGHTYHFRCRSTDNAGNTGGYPAEADTSIMVDPAGRPSTPWWNDGYSYKRNITILNNMSDVTLPPGYPVRLHFDSGTTPTAEELYNASRSSIKCDDLRIIYNDTTEIDRLVEKCSNSAIDIRFRTQVGIAGGVSDNTTYQLYYGNLNAVNPPSDQRNVWAPPNDSQTVGLWYLSEGIGSISSDFSGAGNNITSIGTLSWIYDGKFGNALSYSDPYSGPPGAYVPGNVTLSSNAFTFEAFVKRYELSWKPITHIAGQGESGDQRERWLLLLQGGRLKFAVWPYPGAGDSQFFSQSEEYLPDTNWHHIAVTFDGDRTVKFYRDGLLTDTGMLSQSGINWTNFDLYIGSGFQPSAERFYGTIDQVRFSKVMRDSFPHAVIATVNNEPSLAVGQAIPPYITGLSDLAFLNLTSYPNPEGGVLVQAVVQNQGDYDTLNGFYTDLYVDHLPTGAGDYSGSLQFWVNDPIAAGETITLTTVINELPGMNLQSESAISESSSTLYAQVDSAGSVPESSEGNNIYSNGIEICVASADAYEDNDSPDTATPIGIGQAQSHNFDTPGDQDWFKFSAEADKVYTISASDLGISSDTYLYLYGPDSTTLIASNDDYGGTLASNIEWTAPVTGTYYLLVRHWNPNVGGCGTGYHLKIARALANKVYVPLVIRSR